MSKTSENYIIKRLERTERDLRWSENRNEVKDKCIHDLEKKLDILANLFEQTTSETGEYVWYRLKGSSLISPEADAYKIIDDLLHPEEELPF